MFIETSPGLRSQWPLFLSKFSQDCNTRTCGQALGGQDFQSIETDKYGCGGSSFFVFGQKNVAMVTGVLSKVFAKTLKNFMI